MDNVERITLPLCVVVASLAITVLLTVRRNTGPNTNPFVKLSIKKYNFIELFIPR